MKVSNGCEKNNISVNSKGLWTFQNEKEIYGLNYIE